MQKKAIEEQYSVYVNNIIFCTGERSESLCGCGTSGDVGGNPRNTFSIVKVGNKNNAKEGYCRTIQCTYD